MLESAEVLPELSEIVEPVVVEEEVKTPEVVVEEPQYSEAEKEAMSKGWVPKDKFKGDLSEFKGAKAFLKDGELFQHISELNKRMKEQSQTIKYLAEREQKIEQAAYQKGIEDLKKQQLNAAEIGDTKTVSAITDKLIELNKTAAPPAQNEVQVAMQDFIKRNPWYDVRNLDNIDMINYAHQIDQAVASRDDMTPVEKFQLIETQVKKKFASNFTSKATPSVAAVESAINHNSTGKKEPGVNDLPGIHKDIFRALKNANPKADLSDYIRQLKAIGEM